MLNQNGHVKPPSAYRIISLACLILASALLPACAEKGRQHRGDDVVNEQQPEKYAKPTGPLPETDEEWKKVLTPEQYHVTRQKGTERAFTGKYWNTKAQGTYRCVCCGEPLFSSETKFDSCSGWPSFWEPVAEGQVRLERDWSLGMVRSEVLCGRCGAHLGHVFDDGPTPTGLRYCINSVSLQLEAEGE